MFGGFSCRYFCLCIRATQRSNGNPQPPIVKTRDEPSRHHFGSGSDKPAIEGPCTGTSLLMHCHTAICDMVPINVEI